MNPVLSGIAGLSGLALIVFVIWRFCAAVIRSYARSTQPRPPPDE